LEKVLNYIYLAFLKMVNQLKKWAYLQSFRAQFLEKKFAEFQNFFSSIMEKSYPADFTRVRPWGKTGDKKNDGYLKSKRMLFQVYAPYGVEEKKTIEKIEEDFKGAIPYWKEYFDTWVFVHNSKDGLSPGVLKKLLDLSQTNQGISCCSWGFEEIKKVFESLDEKDMEDLCGKAPSEEDMEELSFVELDLVIKTISRKRAPTEPIRPVSKEKLKFNSLSEDVEALLLAGMKKSSLVKKYFDECLDPKLGDEIAEVFNSKYKELKTKNLSPDIIFTELQKFAGGLKRGEPRHEAAVLAVLAHLFEMCDIFDNPLEVKINDITN
jgi:hypothetical protein